MAQWTIDRHTLSIGRVISFTSHKFEKPGIRKVLRPGTSSERIILLGILQCRLKIIKAFSLFTLLFTYIYSNYKTYLTDGTGKWDLPCHPVDFQATQRPRKEHGLRCENSHWILWDQQSADGTDSKSLHTV